MAREATAPASRSGAPAALAVVVALFLAWRPLLDCFFQMDDFSQLAGAQHGTVLSRLAAHAFGFSRTAGDVYWRPGWHALFEFTRAIGGMEPRAWFAVVLVLVELLALALFALLVREGVDRWLAAAGAVAFAVAPDHVEAFGWISAALNVLPCTLLLLLAGRAILDWLQGAGGRRLVAALLLFLASLTFREAAYHLPLLIVVGAFALAGTRRRSLVEVGGAAALFGGCILLHYFVANKIGPSPLPAATLATAALRNFADFAKATSGSSGPLAAAAVALVWLVLLATGSPRTRFFLVWAPLATFPYVMRSPATRFTPFVDAPLYVGLVLWLSERTRGSGWKGCVAAGLTLAALIAWNLLHLPAERRIVVGRGEQCRAAADSLRAIDLTGVTTLVVDDAPYALLRDLDTMVKLYAQHPGASTPEVRILGLLAKPPFLLHRDQEIRGEGPGVAFFHCDLASARITRTTRDELIGGLIPLPMAALRYEAVVVEPAAALREIAARRYDLTRQVVLDREPSPPLRVEPGARGNVRLVGFFEPNVLEFEVAGATEGFLVLHLYGDLARRGSTATIDGAPAPLVPADGLFNAMRVPAGTHRVRLFVRGNLLGGRAESGDGR